MTQEFAQNFMVTGKHKGAAAGCSTSGATFGITIIIKKL